MHRYIKLLLFFPIKSSNFKITYILKIRIDFSPILNFMKRKTPVGFLVDLSRALVKLMVSNRLRESAITRCRPCRGPFNGVRVVIMSCSIGRIRSVVPTTDVVRPGLDIVIDVFLPDTELALVHIFPVCRIPIPARELLPLETNVGDAITAPSSPVPIGPVDYDKRDRILAGSGLPTRFQIHSVCKGRLVARAATDCQST